ncbi:transcriptional regulator, TetR family [Parasphingorhabdus marina DSM 22363]|uniref:Transcriptional regulator, TetR family n=1 Tax=Parasphingorhabdus marina DSM 22363 TaxID=1123272 RepID=A0A1N6CYI9_9SPHN|nr:TetR/AcrR family transcriptional regulator [Parasphingorhabdus marina]SIN63621.1 transcriptional regulator, TetR family [Parasphingorhabdus marina DSM 22363]
MQEKKAISNAKRTEKTRKLLIKAGKRLFVEKGFAATSTPEIVKSAGVTRGALYHHFADKTDLLRAVVEQDCAAVGQDINRGSQAADTALDMLKSGSSAFVRSITSQGRARTILIEGPAVLGQKELLEIEDRHTRLSLKQGLQAALDQGAIKPLPLQPMVELVSSMLDGAALKVEAGFAFEELEPIIHAFIDGLAVE